MNELAFPSGEARSSGFGRAEAEPLPGEPGTALVTRYLTIAYRSKWIILGAIALVLGIGLVLTMLATPRYTATTRIEINRVGSRIVNLAEVQPETSAIDMEFYQTQYGILEARSLAERVVRDLRLADNAHFFEIFGDQRSAAALAAGQQAAPGRTRDERQRIAADILLHSLRVSPIRLSRLVDLEWTSPDPQLSAQVANAWANAFIQFNLERRYGASAFARQFLEQRLGQLRQRLEESERAVVNYASQQGLISLPIGQIANANGQLQTQERSLVADNLVALNAALAEATADRVRAQSRLASAGSNTSEALQNAAITGLRERRAESAAEYSRLMTQFTPDYPPAAALAAQVRQLDQSIAREEGRVQSSLQGAFRDSLRREQDLQQRVHELQSQFLSERRRSIQYNIFQRDADTNRELYNGLLQRYKEIGVAGGVGENNIQIVDPARTPERPSSPRLLVNLLASLVLGIGLGVGLALLREQVEDTVNDPSEAESRVGLPLVGVITKSAMDEPLEELRDPKSPLMEAGLSIQSNLVFSTDHGFPRSTSITSTRPGEGKSTTAQTIAFIMGRQGVRTLLVDADMRSPSLHHRLGLSNTRGLSNYLSGNHDLVSLVQQPKDQPFVVLTAGPQPPNAAELLRGEGFERLMTDMKSRYDCVLIDTPPVLGLADAPIVASWAEATLFVIEAHGTRTRAIRQALQRLRTGRAHVTGCVLTKFDPHRGHFSYGQSYGYGYGYGYGKAETAQG